MTTPHFIPTGSRTAVAGRRFGVAAIVVPICLALVVSGCSGTRKKGELAFDGVLFKTKAEMVSKEEREHFTAYVYKAGQTIDGAREAGRHQGVRYCIENYGTSQIKWISGPDAEPQALRFDKDTLLLEGICKP